MEELVEELQEELEKILQEIETISTKVHKKELDAFEGFMLSEKHKNRIIEIGNKLKEKNIDITTAQTLIV